MEATFQDLMTEGLVGCRGIMALCPAGAERGLQVTAFSAEMEAGAGLPGSTSGPSVHWFRLVDQGKESFICWRDDHTGAFENSAEKLRETGIDPASLPVLEIDHGRHIAPASLAAFRTRLESVEEETFTQDEKEKLAAFRECLGLALNACVEGYTDRMTVDGLKTLLPIFMPTGDAPVTLAQRLEALEQMDRTVLRLRAFFAADVFLTARLTLFATLLKALADQMKEVGAEEWQIVMQLTRFFLTPYSEGVSNPDRLIPNLVEKMSYEGYGGLVETLAKRCRDAGMSAIEAALKSNDLEEYGASLYAATHECFAANHLYEILDFDAKRHPERTPGAWWAQSAKVAEEKLVRCTSALFRLSAVPFLSELNRHRARVSEAYLAGGEDARAGVINDLIENNYFYPRSFEKELREPAPFS